LKTELDFNKFVDELMRKIDITLSQYDTAVTHYNAVAKCLSDGGVADEIYVQGSFAYGTVVRPMKNGKDADFDIDLVSQALLIKDNTLPGELKSDVRQCLEESPYHAPLLSKDEGRRSWKLEYAQKDGVGFHMDVLPCVSEPLTEINKIIRRGVPPHYADTAIAITDKDKEAGTYDWASGNARGLASWFNDINAPYLDHVADAQRRVFVMDGLYATIDEVPVPVLRSSLQRVIQLLKRHRDCRFDGSKTEEYKPISMIITVLAAKIAQQKAMYTASIFELLSVVVQELSRFSNLLNDNHEGSAIHLDKALMSRDQSHWYIPNPVNPGENFAERWSEDNNARAKAFFQWVSWLRTDMAFNGKKSGDLFESLGACFGVDAVSRVYRALDLNPKSTPAIFIRSEDMPKPYRA